MSQTRGLLSDFRDFDTFKIEMLPKLPFLETNKVT